MNKTDCSNAAIVATELATNIFRYAPGGEILLRSLKHGDTVGVEIMAIDRGPGMDVAHCLEDGNSSGGTAGQGLGAVQRLSAEFDIYSTQRGAMLGGGSVQFGGGALVGGGVSGGSVSGGGGFAGSGQPSGTVPAGGTVVLSRVLAGVRGHSMSNGFSWGVINRPAPKEQLCGDTWRIAERDGELAIMIADGLGHGPQAAEAADTAAAAFEENPFLPLKEYMAVAHRRMNSTRGAAVAVAHINGRQGALNYAGVGNIAGSLRTAEGAPGKGLMSHNGTVGAEMRKVVSLEYECPERSLLIMHSDGVQSRWSLEKYPGLVGRHPALVAAVLYRDFCRGPDDVTVLAVRSSVAASEKNLVA